MWGEADRGLGRRGMAAGRSKRDSAAMNSARAIRPVSPIRELPDNVIVLPLESTIPPEMTLGEWRHRKLAGRAKRRRRREFFTRPAREAA